MRINVREPRIRMYGINDVCIGDVCMGVKNEHYYLVVESENKKTQLVDLTENKIVRDGRTISLIPTIAELEVTPITLSLEQLNER